MASVFMFSGCEKYAYTSTSNIIRASRGGSFTTIRSNYSMNLGESVYIIVTEKDKTHFTSGEYSADINPVEGGDVICANAEAGFFKNDPCLVLKATATGQSEVTVHFRVNGFHYHRSFTLTVK